MKKHLFTLCLFLAAFTLQLSAQTVYITRTGEKYHTGTCRYLSQSKFSIELKDALNQGYAACKVCKPTQTLRASKAENKEKKVENKDEDEPTGTNKESTQCTATTQKGSRCKRITTSANGKCWQHGGN